MIKTLKIIALSSFLVLCTGMVSHAFLLPPGPFTPTIDVPTDVTFTLKNVGSVAQNVASQAQTYANNATAAVKAAKKNYMDKFMGFMGGMFQKKEKQDMPGSKSIQESKIADIYDADSVKQALYQLFLAYPADCEKGTKEYDECRAYEAKAEEFYQDTVIEIYTSVRLLEKELETLNQEVDNLSTTFSGGGGSGAESGDDENGVWKNAYNAYETMDSILKITQELLAMKTQYEAALLLRNQIKPAGYVSEEEQKNKEKTSHNISLEQQKIASTGIIKHSETLMFGQLSMMSNAKSSSLQGNVSSSQTATEEISENEEYVYNPQLYGKIKFEDAAEPPIDSPFAGSEAKILELDKIAPIYEKAQEALMVHNLMQSLESYQGIFKNYEQYKRLHEKSLEALSNSDKCVIQYLNRRYSSPETVWNGQMGDAAVNDYDSRKGISGWAIKAFEVAKSEESMPVETDDLGTMEINVDVDINDANSAKTLQAELEKQNTSTMTDASQTEEIEAATRESNMISFNVGAEAARLLVEDQYKATPQWGRPNVKFPVWNDQISFYNQYLDGKYGNIKDYLQQYDVSSVIVEIAYPLNDLLVEDAEEKANNRAGLDKLSSVLASEAQLINPAQVLDELEQNRDKLIQQALNNKEMRMRELEKQKQIIEEKINKASELRSGYSEQLNTAQENKYQAQLGIDSKNTQIGDLEDRKGTLEDNLITQSDVEYTSADYEVSPEKVTQTRSTNYKETQTKEMLFDTGNTVSEYKDAVGKLNYKASQIGAETTTSNKQNLQPTTVISNPDGSVSLYPETELEESSTSNQKSLFRKRPFSSNDSYAPTTLSKYSLSRTLYFGAQDDTFNYAAEKNKLDAEFEAKMMTTKDVSSLEKEEQITAKTQEAVTVEYTDETVSEQQVINMEDSEGLALAKEERSAYANQVNKNEILATGLKTQVEGKNKEIEELNKQLEAIKAEMSAVEQEYISQVQEIEKAYQQKLKEAQTYIEQKRQAKETLDLVSYYQEKVGLPTIGEDGLMPPFSLLNILSVATGLTDDTKNYALQLVEDAKKSIINLGDGVYVGSYGDKVLSIHQDLITKLKSLPIEGLQGFSSAVGAYAQTASIIKPLSSIFEKLLLSEVCADGKCEQADEEYFVGSYAKARDFMAPKNSLKEYLPPLREVIHFDDVDHDNIETSVDGGISKEGFLNYGASIPEIWKLLLKEKTFVDKNIDLKVLLSEGDEASMFMRGGRYPCRIDDKIVDLSDISGEFTIYMRQTTSEEESKDDFPSDMFKLPQCQDITLEGTEGLLSKIYMTVKDKIEEVTAPGKIMPLQNYSSGSHQSELGTLLKMTDSGLYYNEAPEKVFARLEKMAEEVNQENSSYEKNMQDVVYQKTFLDHNQIGDFLRFVEQEISYRQAMEEMKLSVDEAEKDLFEQFEKIGFKPSVDYNLARQEDYDLTKETLRRHKNSLIKQAQEELSSVSISNNEVVEERVAKIKNIFTALSKDKEAYISLSDTTDSGAELDERIKTEEVNHQVTSEYQKEAEEEFEKQLNSFPIPFCAAY